MLGIPLSAVYGIGGSFVAYETSTFKDHNYICSAEAYFSINTQVSNNQQPIITFQLNSTSCTGFKVPYDSTEYCADFCDYPFPQISYHSITSNWTLDHFNDGLDSFSGSFLLGNSNHYWFFYRYQGYLYLYQTSNNKALSDICIRDIQFQDCVSSMGILAWIHAYILAPVTQFNHLQITPDSAIASHSLVCYAGSQCVNMPPNEDGLTLGKCGTTNSTGSLNSLIPCYCNAILHSYVIPYYYSGRTQCDCLDPETKADLGQFNTDKNICPHSSTTLSLATKIGIGVGAGLAFLILLMIVARCCKKPRVNNGQPINNGAPYTRI